MKTTKFLQLLAIASIFLASCGAETAKEEQLCKEVFAIHDEVMPRMGEIVNRKESLRALTVDSAGAIGVMAAILQLEQAEDGMMQWMNKFKQPEKLRETLDHEAIMSYLQNEKLTITKVRDDMNGSLESGRKLLVALGK